MASLILASTSPQRKTLLEGLGLSFEVISSSVLEDDHPELNPLQRSIDLARLKAQDVARKHQGQIVIGCDTLVVAADGTLLEKPVSDEDALRMLSLQSASTSLVHSAVCVVDAQGKLYQDVSSSTVRFKQMTDDEKEWWISTGLWRGRSGGFQIDGLGQLLIETIEGDWTGIVGLPVFLLGKLLREAGVTLSA